MKLSKKKNFLIFTLLLFCLLIVGSTDKQVKQNLEQGKQFSPAYPRVVDYEQPDGTILKIKLKGDQWLHYGRTLDGYTVLANKKGFYNYAVRDDKGDLVRSPFRAHNPGERSRKEEQKLKKHQKYLDFSARQRMEARNKYSDDTRWGGVTGQFPTTGTRNMLIILGDFSDLSFTKSQSQFNDLFNTGSSSFKAYYLDNSYNLLTVNCTVVGPYTSSQTAANSNEDCADCIRGYISSLVDLAENDGLNFANFDNNSDGYVDGLFVVHAGYGEEAGAPSWTIWSHAWTLSTYARTYDGVTIDRYATVPELRGNSGSTMTAIGVCAHEFGHLLGAPDLYDTDGTGSGGSAWDCKYWDVMSGGSWNDSGDTPAQHCMYSKWKMGWTTPTVLSTTATGLTLNETGSNSESYRINSATSNEFFILENRQQTGWDSYIGGHGLMIFHIDGNYIDGLSGNTVNADPSHQGVDVEEADDLRSSSNYAGDPFPGSGNNTSFTDATTPSARDWNGTATAKPVTNIAENSGVISFDITVGGGGGPTYCTSQGNDYSYEWVSRVQVGGLDKSSGAAGYSDYTSTTCDLTAGANTGVTLTPGFSSSSYSEYWVIWIDFNADGDFTDSGEQVFSGNGTSTVSGNFTVPSGASGITRMRVTMKYNAAPTSCETFTYGEVEDYTVDIGTGGGPLPPVANFSANDTTVTEGDYVTFTDLSTNSPTSWSWTFTGGTPSSSTSQNPVIQYNTAGTYAVSLTATNAAGSDGETKTNYITVSAPPADEIGEAVDYSSTFTKSGSANWYKDTGTYYYGGDSAASGTITHNQSTTIETNVTVGTTQAVKFYWKVSSESNYDFLRFYIDGVLQEQISGTVDWTQVSYNIGAGTHTLKWTYYKDGSVSSGSDRGWV
ncbi:MAG: M6 family metalloprotease domain-containing protein, partial [Candidatus Aminicenantes bacterium]|nr:M6 family metalloprotease domain-containing protein [Candidatus Aminicenantes bacterium]